MRNHFHNSIIQVIESTGVLGLLSMVLFICTILVRAITSLGLIDETFTRLSVIALVSGVCSSIFSTMFHGPLRHISDLPFECWVALGLLSAISIRYRQGKQFDGARQPKETRLWMTLILIVTILSLLCGIVPLLNKYCIFSAKKLLSNGQIDTAERRLNTACFLEPLNAEVRAEKGALCVRTDRLTQALTEYKNALKLNPLHSPFLSETGRIAMWLGEYEKAEQFFKKGITADPYTLFSKDLYAEMALCLAFKGDFQLAAEAFSKAIKYHRFSHATSE